VVALGHTHSEFSLREGAERIAGAWPPEMVLHVLLKHLDTPSSQLRGGLARLAALLPREQAIPLLRRHAGNRAASPQGRTTAAMILERYLHDTVPAALLADLQTSDDAALQSLREAVEEGRTNRHVLLEYVTQMEQHNEEIAQLVMHHLDSLAPADRVDLLRLMAQESRPRVARSALNRLEVLAAEEPRALRALYSLQWTLPPEQAQPLERVLRKLQFRGKQHTRPTPTGRRALLAPAEPGGHLWMWLVQMPADREHDGRGSLAGMLLHPEAGILHNFFAHGLEPSFLPSPAPLGALVDVPLEETAGGRFLEVPYDLGRLLLRQALTAHWSGRARRPLSGEYRLANDEIWQDGPPAVEGALAARLVRPQQPLALDEAGPSVELLLHDAAMAGWSLPAAASMRDAGVALPELGLPAAEVARLMVRELAQTPSRDEMVAAVAAGLWMQSVWLQAAGRAEPAEAAYRLSASTRVWPIQQNPLILAMVTAAVQRLPARRRGQTPGA
jgi:hypothetical protein